MDPVTSRKRARSRIAQEAQRWGVPEDEYRNIRCLLIEVIHGFAPSSALELIKYFHSKIKLNEPYDRYALSELLVHAFGQILDHKRISADTAFGLRRKPGQRDREDQTQRNVRIAARIILNMRNGQSWESAVASVAESEFGEDEGIRIAQRAYSQFSDALSEVDNEFLTQISEPIK